MPRFVLGLSLVCVAGALLHVRAGKTVYDRSTLAWEQPSVARSAGRASTPSAVKDKSSVELLRSYQQLPLSFEPNLGQANTQAKFLARGSGYEVFLTPGGAVLGLHAASRRETIHPATLRMQLVGANSASPLSALERLPGKSNYIIGNRPEHWHTDIPTYRRVEQKAVYPRIDLVYYGTQHQLEYDFVIAPGADPSLIRLRMEGADAVRVDPRGDLIATVAGSEMRFQKPVAYQVAIGKKQPVAVDYVRGRAGTVGFKVAEFDRKQALVIDPILSYSTYLGGSNIDGANAIAVAPDNTAFIAGGTFSTDFPTAHPLQPNAGGPSDLTRDAFVAKLSADGSTLLYSTYLGGENDDVANGIAVDAFGDAYVIGTTRSPHFPVTPADVLNPECGGDGKCGASFNPGGLIVSNAFVTKLNPAGSGLVYSTFFGEYENVRGLAIAVDANQLAYITGSTEANFNVTVVPPPTVLPPSFPITPNAFQPLFGGGTKDAFVAKISATGETVEYSSYLGGSDEDLGYGIAVDSNADAFVTGLTYSTDFPMLNAVQPSFGGAGDAFFSKVNTDGSGTGPGPLLYSTYLGGSNLDQGNGVAVDSSGIAYIAGFVGAGSLPFSATGSFNGGDADAFAAKIDATKAGAASLLYFRYFGGSGADAGNGIGVDPSGNVYVTGSTVSTDFPTTAAVFEPKFGGGNADAFVTKLDPTGAKLVYSSYLGGTNTDIGNGIAVDTSGNAYVAGQTCSLDFPLANPEQATPGSNCDAFVSKVSILNGIQLNPAGLVFPAQSLGTSSQPQPVTLTNGDNPVTISSILVTGANPGDFGETTTCGPSLAAGAQCTITVTFTPTAAGIRRASVTITDDAPGSPQVLNLNGQSSTLTLSASSLSFGQQQVGTASVNPLSITATNNGPTVVTFTGITASGDFAETDDCTKVPLQPTTNCVINVTYTPTTAGSSIGALTLTDNVPGSPQIVLLTGTGFGQQSDFTLSAVPSNASVPAGKSAAFTLLLSSVGGFNQPVSLSCQGLPRGASCLVPSNSTVSGAATSVTLTITTATRAFATPIWRIRLNPSREIWNLPATVLAILVLLLLVTRITRSLWLRRTTVLLGAVIATIVLVGGCNSGGQVDVPAGTPAGAYQIIVIATSGSITHTTTVGLQVN